MTNFIVQFPLKTEKYQEDILDKRFEIGRQIYNSLVNITQKRYKEMIKTKRYRNLISQLSGDKNKDKRIWKQINDTRKQFGMSEYHCDHCGFENEDRDVHSANMMVLLSGYGTYRSLNTDAVSTERMVGFLNNLSNLGVVVTTNSMQADCL